MQVLRRALRPLTFPSSFKRYHAVASNQLEPSYRVRMVPMFQDNYGYLLIDQANQTMVAVDPADVETMQPVIQEEEERHGHELMAILTTHKHWDHAGGNIALAKQYKNLQIYGPAMESIPAITNPLNGTEEFKIGATTIKVLFTPCHTSGHIVYLITGDSDTPPLLFSGDTLFVGGCGRFFEGSAQDMYSALYDKILKLPKDTRLYCGHEYTMSNMRFALSIDPLNEALRAKFQWVKERRTLNVPTIPSTLEEEQMYNPFLRVHDPAIQEAMGSTDAIEVMARLRQNKDNFS